MRLVVSLIDGEVRKKGDCCVVVGSLRANRFRFIAKDGKIYSTEKQKGWKILPKTYKKKLDIA